jgi:hypothetical protein
MADLGPATVTCGSCAADTGHTGAKASAA